tara:strand:+ start:359 stop:1018 length:660 start_codon:yes stop_codon:yes gene_type:complete
MFVYPFGPLLYHNTISNEFHKFLLDGAQNSKRYGKDSRSKLAGNIELQRTAIYNPEKFSSFVEPHIRKFIKEEYETQKKLMQLFGNEDQYYKATGFDQYKYANLDTQIKFDFGDGPWINFQHKGEFNPMHDHTGKISAIIFIDIPEEIAKERENSDYATAMSGCLLFNYDKSRRCAIGPKTKSIFLFPSNLDHTVYPFSCDVERISMSFNVYDYKVDET